MFFLFLWRGMERTLCHYGWKKKPLELLKASVVVLNNSAQRCVNCTLGVIVETHTHRSASARARALTPVTCDGARVGLQGRAGARLWRTSAGPRSLLFSSQCAGAAAAAAAWRGLDMCEGLQQHHIPHLAFTHRKNKKQKNEPTHLIVGVLVAGSHWKRGAVWLSKRKSPPLFSDSAE